MKKILSIIIVIALVFTSFSISSNKVEAKKIDVMLDSYLKCIKVSWNKNKKAKKYVVYRALVKNPNNDKVPKRNKFKRIKKTKKCYFKDKKAKKSKYYTYYVDVIGQNGKVIDTSYTTEYSVTYICKGLDRAELDNWGNGEEYKNSKSRIYLHPSIGSSGYYPKKIKYVIYRKNKKSKKAYKKIKLTRVKKDDNPVYVDKTVKAGETYLYKCKAYVKKGKKKYYSSFSKPLEISAVNLHAALSLDVLTKSGEYNDVKSLYVDIKVKDIDKYNGRIVFYKQDNAEDIGVYRCYQMKDDYNHEHAYDFILEQYSKDGTNWENIPQNGVELPKMGTLYLRFKLEIPKYSSDKSIIFAGPGSGFAYSHVDSGGAKYYGSGDTDNTAVTIDFNKGDIQIYNYWE